MGGAIRLRRLLVRNHGSRQEKLLIGRRGNHRDFGDADGRRVLAGKTGQSLNFWSAAIHRRFLCHAATNGVLESFGRKAAMNCRTPKSGKPSYDTPTSDMAAIEPTGERSTNGSGIF